MDNTVMQKPYNWGNSVKEAKNVNAKTSTGEVTVSGKGVKFSARTAKATLAV